MAEPIFFDTKVCFASPEEAAAVQLKLFELGFSWGDGTQKVEYTSYSYLYIRSSTITRGTTRKTFDEHEFTEVSANQILNFTPIIPQDIENMLSELDNLFQL